MEPPGSMKQVSRYYFANVTRYLIIEVSDSRAEFFLFMASIQHDELGVLL